MLSKYKWIDLGFRSFEKVFIANSAANNSSSFMCVVSFSCFAKNPLLKFPLLVMLPIPVPMKHPSKLSCLDFQVSLDNSNVMLFIHQLSSFVAVG